MKLYNSLLSYRVDFFKKMCYNIIKEKNVRRFAYVE